jgi:hypothetical protein
MYEVKVVIYFCESAKHYVVAKEESGLIRVSNDGSFIDTNCTAFQRNMSIASGTGTDSYIATVVLGVRGGGGGGGFDTTRRRGGTTARRRGVYW